MAAAVALRAGSVALALGLCACAPAAQVDGRLVGRLDAAAVDALAEEMRA